MHIEYFNYFYLVAKEKSISKVANEVHISQPALSQQISKLEEHIGYTLLNRSNKGVELTRQGQIVYKYVENIFRTLQTMDAELKNDENSTREIKIEAAWPLVGSVLPNIIFELKHKYVNYRFEMISNSYDNIATDVKNNIFNIGIAYSLIDDPLLKSFHIADDKLVMIAKSDYDIPDVISCRDLYNYPLLILKDRLNVKDSISSCINCSSCMKNLNIIYESDGVNSIKLLTLKGNGVSFLPYLSVYKEIEDKQLKMIEVEGIDHYYPITLIYKKESYDSFTQKFIDDFLGMLKEIL